MFKWLKSLFGLDSDVKVTATEAVKEVESPAPVEAPAKTEQAKPVAKPKTQAKKPATKKTATKKPAKKEAGDLESMNKTQLLAEAKKRGVKANASLKKDEILERIKNG